MRFYTCYDRDDLTEDSAYYDVDTPEEAARFYVEDGFETSHYESRTLMSDLYPTLSETVYVLSSEGETFEVEVDIDVRITFDAESATKLD